MCGGEIGRGHEEIRRGHRAVEELIGYDAVT